MKHILIYFLLFFINIMGMEKTDAECFLLYKAHIAHTLPREICNHIDHICIQLANNKLKKNFIKKERGRWQTSYNPRKYHSLIINNNGHYFTHTSFNSTILLNTEKKQYDTPIETGSKTPIYFSPDNTYCVLKNHAHTYLYNLITTKEHPLITKEENTCRNITISNNSQHILLEGRHDVQQAKQIYYLWSLNEQLEPYRISLKDDLFRSAVTIFHPDNKHIIHNLYGDELHLYNIATQENRIISSEQDESVCWLNTLSINPDNKTIIATTNPKKIGAQSNYILFNIEDINNVTSITLAPQSCHTTAKLPVLSIPYKQILTHITNQGRTLQLIDHKQQDIVKHHAPENSYITALAVDTTGNYLAVGHSDGTILIWNISDLHSTQHKKTFIKSTGAITSLTLTDNNLLLSQSQSDESGSTLLWDIYGNEIMHFGDNIFKSIISPNGKTIAILYESSAKNPISRYNSELVTYYQTDEILSVFNKKELSLVELYNLIHATTIQ